MEPSEAISTKWRMYDMFFQYEYIDTSVFLNYINSGYNSNLCSDEWKKMDADKIHCHTFSNVWVHWLLHLSLDNLIYQSNSCFVNCTVYLQTNRLANMMENTPIGFKPCF